MFKKKISVSILACALVVTAATTALAVTPAVSSSSSYAVCTISGCTQTGNHTHNGTTYGAHHANDGHSYHTQGGAGHVNHRYGNHH